MASLRKFRRNWYSRIRWYNDRGFQDEKLIALRTSDKTEAHIRNREVTRYEKDIIAGMDFTWSWMKDGGKTEVKELSLVESATAWIERRQKQPDIRKKTIEINKNSLNHLYKTIPKTYPLKSITTEHMDKFRDDLIDRGLSNTSINIHLRSVKSFLRYVWKRSIIDRVPIIDMVNIDEALPIYLTDDEFHSILNEIGVDSFYGRVFFFYRETGVRLREPFISTLDGNWLDIPNTSKGKKPRSIELDQQLLDIYKELRKWADTCGLVEGSRGRHLSKKFKKTLRKCGIDESKHMHSLRHTYAVRQRVMGETIANISSKLGHRSVNTTEIYTKIDLKKLRRHFPTLVSTYTDDEIESQKLSKSLKRDTFLRDTHIVSHKFINGGNVN